MARQASGNHCHHTVIKTLLTSADGLQPYMSRAELLRLRPPISKACK